MTRLNVGAARGVQGTRGYTLIEYVLLVAIMVMASAAVLIPLTSGLASVSKTAETAIERAR